MTCLSGIWYLQWTPSFLVSPGSSNLLFVCFSWCHSPIPIFDTKVGGTFLFFASKPSWWCQNVPPSLAHLLITMSHVCWSIIRKFDPCVVVINCCAFFAWYLWKHTKKYCNHYICLFSGYHCSVDRVYGVLYFKRKTPPWLRVFVAPLLAVQVSGLNSQLLAKSSVGDTALPTWLILGLPFFLTVTSYFILITHKEYLIQETAKIQPRDQT